MFRTKVRAQDKATGIVQIVGNSRQKGARKVKTNTHDENKKRTDSGINYNYEST